MVQAHKRKAGPSTIIPSMLPWPAPMRNAHVNVTTSNPGVQEIRRRVRVCVCLRTLLTLLRYGIRSMDEEGECRQDPFLLRTFMYPKYNNIVDPFQGYPTVLILNTCGMYVRIVWGLHMHYIL